jgi:hypothetical protein
VNSREIAEHAARDDPCVKVFDATCEAFNNHAERCSTCMFKLVDTLDDTHAVKLIDLLEIVETDD